MREKCPNCGKPIEKTDDICPNCGFALSKANFQSSQTEKANDQDPTMKVNSEPEPVNEEAIEWADLKDMSLGHVMELFNEQNQEAASSSEATPDQELEPELTPLAASEDGDSSDKRVEELVSEAAAEQEPQNPIKESAEAEDTTQDSEEGASSELAEPVSTTQLIAFEEEELSKESLGADEMAKPVEETEELAPNETLQAYIEAHKKSESEKMTANLAFTQTAEAPSEKDLLAENTPATEPVEAEEPASEGVTATTAYDSSATSQTTEAATVEKAAEPMAANDAETAQSEPAPLPSENSAASSAQTDPGQESHQPRAYKKGLMTIAAVLVVGAGAWAVYNQSQSSKADSQATSSEVEAQAKQTQKQLDSYYLSSKKQLIKPEMVGVSLAPIEKNLQQLKNSSPAKGLTKQYQALKDQISQITQVNALFDAPIINGDQLTNANLAADQAIHLQKFQGTEPLPQLLNQALDRAQQQYAQLQKAKQAVATIYQNEQPTAALTRETYNAAKAQVDQVASAALKKGLLTQLEKAEQTLVAAETAAQKEQEQTSESTETTQPTQITAKTEANGYSAPNSDGVYTDPLYPTDPNDVADTTNPAWTWNPGVKEKVIATAIQRGYIVEGGYQLEPAKIVNGEGYYNLYATNNKSSLLAGLPDGQQHVYIVTINAKTGWFKGNASRNAGR